MSAQTRSDLKIPYGISDFQRIRWEGYYYVDKTSFVALLEARDSFAFFVRPRRFGKSFFVDMLHDYYDLREKDNFEDYFGGLWIGEHPTENRNRYLVLHLDFSAIGGMGGATLEDKFAVYMDAALVDFINRYRSYFPAGMVIVFQGKRSAARASTTATWCSTIFPNWWPRDVRRKTWWTSTSRPTTTSLRRLWTSSARWAR